jgi:hypothetical protein
MLSRGEALAALQAGQDELDRLVNQLTDAQLDEPGTLPGGWAAKDVVGHVAFWEELGLETIDSFRGGITPRVATTETDALNAQNQAEQAGRSIFELRNRAGDAHEALLGVLHTLTDAEWHARVPWPDDRVLGDYLGGVLGAPDRPFGHAYAHLDDLRKFVDAP